MSLSNLCKRRWVHAAQVALATGAACGSAWVFALGRTYTSTDDFNLGVRVGVVADGGNLTLSAQGSTFPVLWVANAGEDTLTKFDTRTNKELARFRTWFGPAGQAGHSNHLGTAFAGAAPLRTSVDLDGNAYVLIRHFDGLSAVLIKVLVDGGIDRNGNGVIDTSSDSNGDGIITGAEVTPLADANGNNVMWASCATNVWPGPCACPTASAPHFGKVPWAALCASRPTATCGWACSTTAPMTK